MYQRNGCYQGIGYDRDLAGEEEHKGVVVSVSIPYHQRHLVEVLDKSAKMNFCAGRSHAIRRLLIKEAAEIRNSERDRDEWVKIWGRK